MSSRKTPQSKINRTDPLENPYIARKLAKLQSDLMDRLHSESLEAEGKQRERVRITARKPGPRTEAEKRKFYRARRLRPKAMPQPEFFTLAEAAKRLEFESEKSVLRLIKAGKLAARKEVSGRKLRWLIDPAELTRYQILSSDFKRPVELVPPLEKMRQWRTSVKCYPTWGEQTLEGLPQYRLTVSIDDFWRFACQRFKSKRDYEAIRLELRTRFPGKPEDFAVRFEIIPQEVDQTLIRIVKGIRPPKLLSEEWSKAQVLSLQFEALEHLKRTALPSLWRAKHGWESYLGKSVKNFYIDKVRKSKRLDVPLADLADGEILSELAYRDWEENEHN